MDSCQDVSCSSECASLFACVTPLMTCRGLLPLVQSTCVDQNLSVISAKESFFFGRFLNAIHMHLKPLLPITFPV